MSEGDGVLADYHDGRSSRPRAVTLRFLSGGRLVIEGEEATSTGGNALEFTRAQVRIESRLGDTPRFVRLPDDRRCEVRDNDALDAALGAWSAPCGRGGAGWLHRVERSWRLVAVSVVVLLAVLDRTLFEESKLPPARRDELRSAFAVFLRAAGEREDYRVEFRHSTAMGANAFALPSGVIVITDALVELAKRDEEILGVLAHECGHVKNRHVLRGVLQNATVAIVVTFVTGDVSATAAAAGAAPAYLLQSTFSQEFEREADAGAVLAMRRAGLAPEHLARMLERLEAAHRPWADDEDAGASEKKATGAEEETRVMDYIGSHPPTHERLRAIRDGGAADQPTGGADEAGAAGDAETKE
jgi:Zn-dependent protease with chaperone function